MSTSASFAPLVFPELATPATGEIAERARVQGHAAGYAAGRREAAAVLERERAAQRTEADHLLAGEIVRLRSAAAALEAAAARLAAQQAAVAAVADEAVLAAAVDIAELVLGRELQDRPSSAVAAVRRALAAAEETRVLAVRMHPDDLPLVAGIADEHPALRFAADPMLDRGDAVADLADGRVDARIGSALNRVRAAVTGEDA
ncbi:MAG: FliH/SctL family protein [Amnibacterium sp.]